MKFKERIKSYKFWVSLSASLVLLLQTLGKAFNFQISADVIDGITMAVCGVLVALGLVEKPKRAESLTEIDVNEIDKQNKQENSEDSLTCTNIKGTAEENLLSQKVNQKKNESKNLFQSIDMIFQI